MLNIVKKINLILTCLTLITLAALNPTKDIKKIEQKNMEFKITYKRVDRVKALENFFKKYNSPLAENAETFVKVADKFNMDYRILPSIACQESTCAKRLIEGTYNPFGWGIYGNNYISFESYDHAIEKVGEGLHKNYLSKGFDTLYEIAPIYTPPSKGSWYKGTRWFSTQIDLMAINTTPIN